MRRGRGHGDSRWPGTKPARVCGTAKLATSSHSTCIYRSPAIVCTTAMGAPLPSAQIYVILYNTLCVCACGCEEACMVDVWEGTCLNVSVVWLTCEYAFRIRGPNPDTQHSPGWMAAHQLVYTVEAIMCTLLTEVRSGQGLGNKH